MERTAGLIDLYDALGLARNDSASELLTKLDSLRVGHTSRAGRRDAYGDRARTQLALIVEAERVFADGDSKDRYDAKLRHNPPAVTPVNWLQRVESSYFQGDFAGADIAVRKVSDADREGPAAWIFSAWIALAPLTRNPLQSGETWESVFDRFRAARHPGEDVAYARSAFIAVAAQAKRYADEAFALDPNGKSADVFHVRGACFYFLTDFARAISNYMSALDLVSDPIEVAELCLQIALAYEAGEEEDRLRNGLAAIERGLAGGEHLPRQLCEALRETWIRLATELSEVGSLEEKADACVTAADRMLHSQADEDSRTLLSDELLRRSRGYLGEQLRDSPESLATQRFVTRWEQGLLRAQLLSPEIVGLLITACQQSVVSECEKTPVPYRSEAYLSAAQRLLGSAVDATSRRVLVANFRANSQRILDYDENLSNYRAAAGRRDDLVTEIEALTREAEKTALRLSELESCRTALEVQEERVRGAKTGSLTRSLVWGVLSVVALGAGVWLGSPGYAAGDMPRVWSGLAIALLGVLSLVSLLLVLRGGVASSGRRARARILHAEKKRVAELRAALRDMAISSDDEQRLRTQLANDRHRLVDLSAKRDESPGLPPQLSAPIPCDVAE